jgi:AbrB family looped-hinge helix DNA binding protein
MEKEPLTSKLTSKSQAVIPRAIRRKLGIEPGDRIRYRMRGEQIVIEKVTTRVAKDDPFIAFDEWASAADDAAFADL